MRIRIVTTIPRWLEYVVAGTLGWLVVIVPALTAPQVVWYDSPTLPFMRTSIEGFQSYSIPLLALVGVLVGGIFKGSAFWLGLCTTVVFLVWSMVDMAFGGDHNLFPFEWAMYAVLALAPAASAVVTRFLVKWWYRRAA